MRYRTICDGQLNVSELGFGAAPLGNEYGGIEEAVGARAVHAALESGINFFDTSPYYGRTLSETRLGEALAGRRDHVVLSTKAGRNDREAPDGFDFRREALLQSIDDSLKRLQTDHVDLLFLHDIEYGNRDVIVGEAMAALQEIKRAGKARFIGVSGYPLDVLCTVIDTAEIDIVLAFCHSDLIDSSAVSDLIPVAEQHDVSVIGASPMHMGLLTANEPPPWHPAGPAARELAHKIKTRSQDLGVTVENAALSYTLALPNLGSVLVGLSSAAEVEASVAIAESPVAPEVIDQISQLRTGANIPPFETDRRW